MVDLWHDAVAGVKRSGARDERRDAVRHRRRASDVGLRNVGLLSIATRMCSHELGQEFVLGIVLGVGLCVVILLHQVGGIMLLLLLGGGRLRLQSRCGRFATT